MPGLESNTVCVENVKPTVKIMSHAKKEEMQNNTEQSRENGEKQYQSLKYRQWGKSVVTMLSQVIICHDLLYKSVVVDNEATIVHSKKK